MPKTLTISACADCPHFDIDPNFEDVDAMRLVRTTVMNDPNVERRESLAWALQHLVDYMDLLEPVLCDWKQKIVDLERST